VDGRHTGRTIGGVEIGAADDDDRHAVAPGIVDRHRSVLQADGAVAQGQERLAGGLEVAVRHRDRRFLVHAGQEFGFLVAAVIDQRLVQAAEARRRVRRQIFEIERLDDIDHEVRAVRHMRARQLLRHRGLGCGHSRGWAQPRWTAVRRLGRGHLR